MMINNGKKVGHNAPEEITELGSIKKCLMLTTEVLVGSWGDECSVTRTIIDIYTDICPNFLQPHRLFRELGNIKKCKC